jgi:hypothetical protein
MWTLISVGIFVIMAVIVLIYSKQLAETKGKLNLSEAQLKVANDSLYNLNLYLDSVNKLLAQRSDSVETVNTGLALNLDQNKAAADSVKNLKDTLTVLLNTTLQQFVNNNEQATERINELYQQAFPGSSKRPSYAITQQIIKTNEIRENLHTVPVIGIRYTEQYKDVAFDIAKRFENRDGKTEPPVQIKGGNFNPVVKYFSDKDKNMAENMVRKLNELYKDKFGQSFEAQFVNITAEPRHFEIWLGKYIKREYYNIKAMNIKKIIE